MRCKSIVGFLGLENYLFTLRELQHITECIFQVTRIFRDLQSPHFPESLLEAKKRVKARTGLEYKQYACIRPELSSHERSLDSENCFFESQLLVSTE